MLYMLQTHSTQLSVDCSYTAEIALLAPNLNLKLISHAWEGFPGQTKGCMCSHLALRRASFG